MTNPDAARRAAEILGSLPTDAGSLASTSGASEKMRAAMKELSGPGGSADARKRLERAIRLTDSADKQIGSLKGFMLSQALADLSFVIAEAGAGAAAG
jgi:hypothetical protein